MTWLHPGIIVGGLLVLIVSQLLYAFYPYPRRAYAPVLVLTLLGFLAGQLWDVVGLPSTRIGEANLLPGILFAGVLQPLAHRLPIRFR